MEEGRGGGWWAERGRGWGAAPSSLCLPHHHHAPERWRRGVWGAPCRGGLQKNERPPAPDRARRSAVRPPGPQMGAHASSLRAGLAADHGAALAARCGGEAAARGGPRAARRRPRPLRSPRPARPAARVGRGGAQLAAADGAGPVSVGRRGEGERMRPNWARGEREEGPARPQPSPDPFPLQRPRWLRVHGRTGGVRRLRRRRRRLGPPARVRRRGPRRGRARRRRRAGHPGRRGRRRRLGGGAGGRRRRGAGCGRRVAAAAARGPRPPRGGRRPRHPARPRRPALLVRRPL